MMIRKGNIDDAHLLHTIGVQTFDDTFGGTCTKEDMQFVLHKFFNLEQCKVDLQDENDNFFFLEEDGIAKGYIRINEIHDYPFEELKPFKCIELVRLYVLKEYHGTHVANDLMQFAFKFAKERNYEKIYLSVWEYNFRARGFYEKIGFVNTGKENDFPLGTTPQTDFWFVKDLI
jgi:ribosomal protein S18 acetylase RimI-like enzyme